MIRKSLGPDDGVVAPVIAVASHPAGETSAYDRSIDARRELLDARKQRVAIDDERQRLDDAGIRIGLHCGGEKHDRAAGHQAVGIEHDHVLVRSAPAGDEVSDVAGLAARVLRPVTIEDARAVRQTRPQGEEGALLRYPYIRIGRVREEEPVEMRAETGALD